MTIAPQRFDAFTPSAATTHNLTLTVAAGAEPGIVVGLHNRNSGVHAEVLSLTLDPGGANEASFIQVAKLTNTNGSMHSHSALWSLLGAAAPAGSYTLRAVLDRSNALLVHAGQYTGMASAPATNVATQTANNASDITQSFVTAASDSLVVSTCHHKFAGAVTFDPYGAATKRLEDFHDSYVNGVYVDELRDFAGSRAITFDIVPPSSNGDMILLAAEFEQGLNPGAQGGVTLMV